jgi:protein-disulfide isomerase
MVLRMKLPFLNPTTGKVFGVLRPSTAFSTALFLLLTMLFLPSANAQQEPSGKGTDELEQKIKEDIVQQLEQKLKEDISQQLPQDIMKVLLQQNLLNRLIERGIDDYFRKQEQARATAREKQLRLASEKASNVRRVTESRDHIYGNPNAPVSLIEYSDLECPYCKQFHSTPKEIVEASGGKVNWVYRHFLLGMHNPGAQKEAEASE